MFLRQSTNSQSRMMPPIIDDTDFKTLETGASIANTDVKLLKNGAASVNKNSGGGTHRANGQFALTFDSSDTDTVGELEVSIYLSGALVAWKTFFVLEEAVYDAWFASSAVGYVANAPVNVAQISGDSGAADALESLLDGTEPVDLTEFIRLGSAALGGKATGLDTGAPTYRNPADTKNVIAAITDIDGNRSVVVLDLT